MLQAIPGLVFRVRHLHHGVLGRIEEVKRLAVVGPGEGGAWNDKKNP